MLRGLIRWFSGKQTRQNHVAHQRTKQIFPGTNSTQPSPPPHRQARLTQEALDAHAVVFGDAHAGGREDVLHHLAEDERDEQRVVDPLRRREHLRDKCEEIRFKLVKPKQDRPVFTT